MKKTKTVLAILLTTSMVHSMDDAQKNIKKDIPSHIKNENVLNQKNNGNKQAQVDKYTDIEEDVLQVLGACGSGVVVVGMVTTIVAAGLWVKQSII